MSGCMVVAFRSFGCESKSHYLHSVIQRQIAIVLTTKPPNCQCFPLAPGSPLTEIIFRADFPGLTDASNPSATLFWH